MRALGAPRGLAAALGAEAATFFLGAAAFLGLDSAAALGLTDLAAGV